MTQRRAALRRGPPIAETGAPFVRVVALSRADAAEWAQPCYAIDYLGQADPGRHPFGTRIYRVWRTCPTRALRRRWRAM